MNARRRRLAAHRTGVEIAPAAADVTLLLPWYTTDRLNDQDTSRVDDAISRHPARAKQIMEMTRECAEIVALNNALGAPSPRALRQLFAAIDAEEGRPAGMTGSVKRLHAESAHGHVPCRAAPRAAAKKIGCCI